VVTPSADPWAKVKEEADFVFYAIKVGMCGAQRTAPRSKKMKRTSQSGSARTI